MHLQVLLKLKNPKNSLLGKKSQKTPTQKAHWAGLKKNGFFQPWGEMLSHFPWKVFRKRSSIMDHCGSDSWPFQDQELRKFALD